MTVAPMEEDRADNPSVAAPDVARPRKSLMRQLLEYLLAWRRRDAARTIRRYDFLVASASDQYRAAEAGSPRPELALGSDRVAMRRAAAVLRDCA